MFVQMCEYDETPHFLQIFDGKLIILQSEKNMHTNNNNNNMEDSKISTINNEYFVLKVYGDATYNSKAVEVYPLSSMSSKECYVLKTTHVWVWCGQSSTGDSREVAKNIGALLGESTLIMEGKEPKEFWRSISMHMAQPLITNGNLSNNIATLNGNSGSNISNGSTCSSPQSINYTASTTMAVSKARPCVQLFIIYARQGKFQSREIIGYDQSDLAPENVYILDAGLVSFIWLGGHAATGERDKYLKLAHYYLETVPIARRPTTAIAVIRQHDEPNVFKGFFENWNYTHWNVSMNC